ncbi:hypothetical protein KFE98_20600 [bacterium SCSIO 12741]|nr:hypothetical protein KFE98_20600 [bacterium SCSIO 12741]
MKKLILLTTTLSFISYSIAQNDRAFRLVLNDMKKNPTQYMIPPDCGFKIGSINRTSPYYERSMTDTQLVRYFTTDSVFRADTTETEVEVYSAGGMVMAIETVQEYHPPSWIKEVKWQIPEKRKISGKTVRDFMSPEDCATLIHTGPIYRFKETSFVYIEYAYGEHNDGSCDGVAWIIEVNNSSGRIEAAHSQYLVDYECY